MSNLLLDSFVTYYCPFCFRVQEWRQSQLLQHEKNKLEKILFENCYHAQATYLVSRCQCLNIEPRFYDSCQFCLKKEKFVYRCIICDGIYTSERLNEAWQIINMKYEKSS